MIGRGNRKARAQLLVFYLLPIFILLFGMGLYFYRWAYQSLDQSYAKRLFDIGHGVTSFIEPYELEVLKQTSVKSNTYQRIGQRLQNFAKLTDVAEIWILDANLTPLISSQLDLTLSEAHFMPHAKMLVKLGKGDPISSDLVKTNEGIYRKYVMVPFLTDDNIEPACVLISASPEFFGGLKALEKGLWTYVLLVCGVLFAISYLVARQFIKPIEYLLGYAEDIERGDYSQPVQVKVDNELGIISETVEKLRKMVYQKDTENEMMLKGIAHELRNPLGGIELCLGLLETENDATKKKDLVERIEGELAHIKKLVSDFLNFGKGLQVTPSRIELASFFTDLYWHFSRDIEKLNIAWQVQVEQNLIYEKVDPFLLKQACLNIIQNAIDAQKGRENWIRITSYIETDNILKVRIEDGGEGISSHDLKNIFTPFYTTKSQGMGLGLAFAKRIVDAHRGSIEVFSHEAAGTRIELRFGEAS